MPEPVHLPPLNHVPLVSILISSYNHADYIEDAVRSVCQQDYRDVEVVICDDGSTDNTLDILYSLKVKECPEIVILEKGNGGQASAVNAAFHNCQGDIICLLDSDDLFYPGKLSKIVQAFQNSPDSGFLIHRLDKIDNKNRKYGQLPMAAKLPSGWYGDYVVASGSCPQGFPVTSGLTLRRDVAVQIFPVNEDIVYDLDEMIRRLALLTTNVTSIDTALGVYRIHGQNMTSMNVVKRLKKMLPIYNTMWEETKKYIEENSRTDSQRFPDLDRDIHHLLMRYVLGRIDNSNDNPKILWRKIKKNKGFKTWPYSRRVFWHVAAHMPDSLFRKLVNLYWDSEGYKLYLSKFKNS